jgi:UTP--glucose-1-phosphate uridylyltransferase
MTGADDAIRRAHREAMENAGMADAAVRTFLLHLDRLAAGASGTLGRDRIDSVDTLPDAEHLDAASDVGIRALRQTVVVKLNGGLGTSMGLERAKSLLEVRDGLTFLDLIARQVLALRERTGADIPLLLMNSFRTREDSEAVLRRYPDLEVGDLPLGFVQHKVPKVLSDTLAPATTVDPDLGWCPPGHGDLYTALATSGVLDRLLDRGVRYAFVSNADNLGAVLDPVLLGHMIERDADFMMEAADRTPADRKGGHLCRLDDGRLALRESAQCPEDERDEFQDVERYRYFNTNNLWVRLEGLRELLDDHDDVLPLDTIVNRKTLDPRDPSSPDVVQLETAMGAALSLFDRAVAVRVPRRRFSPVKTTDDLLAVRSDAYVLDDQWRITLRPQRTSPPTVALDGRHFKLIDDFEARFKYGPPSLARCDALTVDGDVWFGTDVEIRGAVRIVATGTRAVVPSGTVVEEDLEL